MHLTFDAELYAPLRGHPGFAEAQRRAWGQVLDALDQHDVRTTCFTTGEFALACPDELRRMVASGHEIASHTMTHAAWGDVSEEAFEREVAESRSMLERTTARPVLGFRAPKGHAPAGLAALLHRHGYRYDASVAPTWMPGRLQGLRAPRRPYAASLADLRREDVASPFVEVPIAGMPGFPVPFGGFFLSFAAPAAMAFPPRNGAPQVLYLHPYDFLDLRGWRQSHPWDKVKRTKNNWRLLKAFSTRMRGQDARLCALLPSSEGTPAATS